MSTFLFWVVFSTVTAFLSQKIRLWHFIQRSIFRVAFWPVALCRVRMSSQHRPSMCSAIRNTCYLDCQRRPAASPAHLKYLAWLADWPLTSGWAAAFIRCPTLCNRLFDRAVRAPMLTGFTEAFSPFTGQKSIPHISIHLPLRCPLLRILRETGVTNSPAEIMAALYIPFPEKKSLQFSRHNFSKHYPIFELFTVTILLEISNRAIIKYSTSHTQTRRYK